MSTDEQKADVVAWECFCDAAYYDMWCVRPARVRKFGEGFHVASKAEAEALATTITALQAERDGALRGLRQLQESNSRMAEGWTALQERIKELEGALRPFAAIYTESQKDSEDGAPARPDNKGAWGFNDVDLTWGDFHAAARALKDSGNGSEVTR